jgi:hypothetical protein
MNANIMNTQMFHLIKYDLNLLVGLKFKISSLYEYTLFRTYQGFFLVH